MKTTYILPFISCLNFRVLAIMLVCAGVTVSAYATEEIYYGGLYRTELLAATPTFEVSDNFPGSVEQTVSVRDLIYFTVDEDTLIKSSAFTHWVMVDIDKYDASDTYLGTETNVQLFAHYDPDEGY